MTLLSAHVALFVVVRFSAAFAFAVAYAFALVAVFGSCPCSCSCSCFCPCLCSCLCNPRPLDLSLSEVVRDPRLVRVQVGLDDRPQLVVLESSPADGLALSVAPHAAPHCFFLRHHPALTMKDFRRRPPGVLLELFQPKSIRGSRSFSDSGRDRQ